MKYISIILFLCISINLISQRVDYLTYTKNTMDGTKYGAISITGDTILKADYDQLGRFNGYNFAARKGKHWGIVDTNNTILIPFEHEFITNLQNERFFGGKGEKMALYDKSNKPLSGYIYDDAWNFADGIAKVKVGSKIGYINKTGLAIVPIKFVEGSDYSVNGKVTVYISSWNDLGTYKLTYFNGQSVNYNTGYSSEYAIVMNTQGKVLYSGTKSREEIKFLDNGYIITTCYDSKGCGNTVGQILSPEGKVVYNYTNCGDFQRYTDSSIVVYSRNTHKYGAITYKGEELLKPNFRDISQFAYGDNKYAKVYFQDGSYFYADKKFRCVEFDGITCPE